MTGTDEGQYMPEKRISRIEGMVMVGRLLAAVGIGDELTEMEVERILSDFDDELMIPDWARKSAALAIHHGIIQGVNNRVDPNGDLTRAQAATIAVRIYHVLK